LSRKGGNVLGEDAGPKEGSLLDARRKPLHDSRKYTAVVGEIGLVCLSDDSRSDITLHLLFSVKYVFQFPPLDKKRLSRITVARLIPLISFAVGEKGQSPG
jgi:hypothetical protein